MKTNFFGQKIGKLGFGLMRLPENDGVIDIEQVKKMVDIYIENGFTYFDTAYGYHGGRSEETVKTAIIERYPRDKVQIATKMPLWNLNDAADCDKLFSEQLRRTGAGYFDFYLLHGLSYETSKKPYMDGVFAYINQKKGEGKIRHFGFSTHDSAENVEKLLSEHPDFEFVQIQLNYVDWESEDVQARGCYEAAVKHNVPVIIMEPVRGGTLATLPDEAAALLKKANPEASSASWAMRYCLSIEEGIFTVLSGMTSVEQMEDNLKTVMNFTPLDNGEHAAIAKVVDIINSIDQIPCTGCRYCIEGCPQKINIPGYLDIGNEYRIYKNMTTARRSMGFVRRGGGTPADCTACGACENICPQKVQVIDAFKDFTNTFLL